MKKGFLIYKSLYEPIKDFTREQKGELLEAIFEYQISGEITEGLTPIVNMAFLFFKNQFDIDNEKYEERCEKAKKSAEARWKKNNANASESIPTDQSHTKDADKRNKIQDTSNKIQVTSNKIEGVKKPSLKTRAFDFICKVKEYQDEVGMSPEEANSFSEYWTEHNEGGQKMLFEMKKTFSIKRRMVTWHKNEAKFKSNSPSGSEAVGTVTDFMKSIN